MQIELATSNKQLGYRSMWNLLRRKYHLVARRYIIFIYNRHDYYEIFGIFIQCYRDTIMRLLREEDPEGCEQRRRRRLKRRVYRDKVS